MELNDIKNVINNAQTAIGIELGSTRIKTVLTAADVTQLLPAVMIGKTAM